MKAIFDIIKYEGDNSTFVWKHPREDFNTHSQLIVHESQEAVLFCNGQACDLFGPGRHTLSTENIPLLRRIQSLATGGVTPFHCEVYFINRTIQMAIKWGLPRSVEFLDPQYHFPLKIGVSGEMALQAEDSRKLLVKLVGTEGELSQARLTEYFRGILMQHVKSCVAQAMRESKISVFEVDERLSEISDALLKRLQPDFSEYGARLQRFTITGIAKPDGETNYERYRNIFFEESIGIREERLRQQRQLIQQETDARRIVMESEALAQKRQLEGYTYQQERGFDVAQRVAANEGAGSFSAMGMGMGMMGGMAGGVGAAVAGLTNRAMDAVPLAPAMPGMEPAEGAQAPARPAPEGPGGDAMADFGIRVAKLEKLKGLIPEEMYQAKLKEIMDSI